MSSEKDVKSGRRGALLGAIGSIAATVATQRGASAAPPSKPGPVPPPKPHPYAGPEPIVAGFPRDIREYPLGFRANGIGPRTGPLPVVNRSTIIFRGQRLVMPVKTAQAFRLLGIRVGETMSRTPGALRTAVDLGDSKHVCHGGTAVSVAIEIEAAQVGEDIELLVENITDESQMFIAALIGIGVQPD